jgi:hypothetical protein
MIAAVTQVQKTTWSGLFGGLNSLFNSISSMSDLFSGNSGRVSNDHVEKMKVAKEQIKRTSLSER